jgi:uncharacterized protein YecT (DUF1311 family)
MRVCQISSTPTARGISFQSPSSTRSGILIGSNVRQAVSRLCGLGSKALDVYFAAMSGIRHLCKQAFALRTAILIATCAATINAPGQAAPVELPTDCSVYASIPLPAEAEKVPAPKTAPACASYRSYRGIGRPINFTDARSCAWQERLAQQADLGQNQKEPTAWVVGGSLILADIYFNGAGIKPNVPLAMRFACESDEGMVKLALPDIAKLKGSSAAQGSFEFCHYALSTIMMNFCSSYEIQADDDRKSRFYSSLKSSLTSEQQAAFGKLLAAQNAYIEAHASEVDQGGSIRGIRTMGSQNILKDLFHTEVVHFERKQWPVYSGNQIKEADALLHREYLKKLQQLKDRTGGGTYQGAVKAEDVSKAEKAWETYRDAWVEFAHLRYPSSVAAIRAKITLDRYRLLKTIL